MTFLNVTELIFNSGRNVSAAIETLHLEGLTDPALLESVKDIGNSIVSQTLYQNFLTMWGISRLGTYATCALAANNYYLYQVSGIPEMIDFITAPMVWCAIGAVALNSDLIASVFTRRHPGVYEVGFRSVSGVGDVFDINQVGRSGTRIGYLRQPHLYAVTEDCLAERGFIKTDAFVVYNEDLWNVPTTYGIEAIHADGYTMICMDPKASPPTVIKGLLETEPGSIVAGDSGLVCSSFNPETDVSARVVGL